MRRKLILSVVGMMTTIGLFAYETWTDPSTGIEWKYEVKDGTVSVGTGSLFDGDCLAIPQFTLGALDIPPEICGKTVTKIGAGAFEYCFGLTSVTIPEGVRCIGSSAFEGDRVNRITIPSSVTNIEDRAFQYCGQLTSLIIPEGVIDIGFYAFWGCSGMTSISIPSSVKRIRSCSFVDCDNLTTVYVSKGDSARIETMLYATGYFDTSKVKFIEEGATPTPTPTPHPTPAPAPEPEPDPLLPFDGSDKHTLNGLVYDSDGAMIGMVQLVTAKADKSGASKVSGFVILEDGKKQSIKAASGTKQGDYLVVTVAVGSIGTAELTIGGDGFEGELGDMKLASGAADENTGILKGTLKLQYFDPATGKLKTKSITVGGVVSGDDAAGTLTVKGEGDKAFAAEMK